MLGNLAKSCFFSPVWVKALLRGGQETEFVLLHHRPRSECRRICSLDRGNWGERLGMRGALTFIWVSVHLSTDIYKCCASCFAHEPLCCERKKLRKPKPKLKSQKEENFKIKAEGKRNSQLRCKETLWSGGRAVGERWGRAR